MTERQQDYLNDIHASGHLLLRLIDDLLDLSCAEAGKLEIVEEAVDLAVLVETATRILEPRARARAQVLRVELPARPLRLRGDERKLLQVLLNLGTNAIKFTPTGGRVVLRAGAGPEPFLEVEDNGVGIAESDLTRVLETFGRADDPFTRRTEGAGLGLSLCRVFVELHGGRLDLHSRRGEGTRVRATLPSARRLDGRPSRRRRT